MAGFEVKGVTIGEGMPKTIVPLMARDKDALVAQARRAAEAGADLVEWRVDAGPTGHAFVREAARALAEACPETPVLATLRTTGQGGNFDLGPMEYPFVLTSILEAEATDLVDVEMVGDARTTQALVEAAHNHDTRAVISYHDFSGTPATARMVELIERMAGTSADVVKLAVMAHSQTDALRLMVATGEARERVGVPLLTLAMGEAGKITRLAGEAFGSALTFCALSASSAPGQVELATAQAALSTLHAALMPEA